MDAVDPDGSIRRKQDARKAFVEQVSQLILVFLRVCGPTDIAGVRKHLTNHGIPKDRVDSVASDAVLLLLGKDRKVKEDKIKLVIDDNGKRFVYISATSKEEKT
jgi:3-dehydroquinate synthetase